MSIRPTHRLSKLALAVNLSIGIAMGQGVDDRPKRRVADQSLQLEINTMISKATRYIIETQAEDGLWIYDFGFRRTAATPASPVADDYSAGLTALALYALAASGIRKDDAAIERGLTWCKANDAPFTTGRRATYCTSLLVLALTRIDAKAHKKWIHRLAKRIADSQLENGMWTYTLSARNTKSSKRKRQRRVIPWLSSGDNSNSQFAVLALWSAQVLSKYRTPSKVWRKVRTHYSKSQHPDGSWSYKAKSKKNKTPPAGPTVPLWMYKPKASMTAGALVSYTCALAGLNSGVKSLGAARRSKVAMAGLRAFRADQAALDRSPLSAQLRDHYYLYSVERVGTILDLRGESWYGNGARSLAEHQRSDGRWDRGRRTSAGFGQALVGSYGDSKNVYQTSLALLFLSKATSFPITPGTRERSTEKK